MYCKKCGTLLDDKVQFCTNCGSSQSEGTKAPAAEGSTFGFALLGFFFPLIGLIIFFVYENKKPCRAKSSLKGAIAGIITSVVISLIFFILWAIFAASVFGFAFDLLDQLFPMMQDALRQMQQSLQQMP